MAPSKARQKGSLHEITTTVATRPIANSQPGSLTLTKEEEQQEEEKQCPTEPKIPKLPPITVNVVPQQGLGCEVVEGLLVPGRNRQYKPNGNYTVGNKPIYDIGFNFMDVRYYDVFAIASGNNVAVYRCLENGSFGLLQAYVDEDKDESFCTLSWTIDEDRSPLLVAAGSNRIIRVINCGTEKLAKSLVGHGGSIHEIKTHASKPELIISASKDESVRLWNVRTGICILIFDGIGGHRNDVLSVDFHPTEIGLFASCGMDNTVKIWSIKEFWVYVEKSYSWKDHPSKFPTRYIQFPVLSAAVHSNFVDCTRWLGDFILSKSVENEILLWEPKPDKNRPGEGSVDILQKYPVSECALWFMKFSCDFHFNLLAVGNDKGEIFVWEVQSSPPILVDRLSHVKCKSPIRQTAVSVDGSTILGASDDGTIWRWDQVSPSSSKTKAIKAAVTADANA